MTSIANAGDRAQFVRCGGGKAKKFEIGRDLFEQHVGADLDRAAFLPSGAQERRYFLPHYHLADESGRINASDVHGQWVAIGHADWGRVDDDVIAGRIIAADGHL